MVSMVKTKQRSDIPYHLDSFVYRELKHPSGCRGAYKHMPRHLDDCSSPPSTMGLGLTGGIRHGISLATRFAAASNEMQSTNKSAKRDTAEQGGTMK